MWIKERLSRLDRESWHARFVRATWGKWAVGRDGYAGPKACPYWWLVVPSSPIVGGLKALWYVASQAIAFGTWIVTEVVATLLGRFVRERPRPMMRVVAAHIDMGPSSNKRDMNVWRFAPAWAVSVPVAVVSILLLGTAFHGFGLYVLLLLALTAVIVGVGSLWEFVLRAPVTRWYGEHCPPITWDHHE